MTNGEIAPLLVGFQLGLSKHSVSDVNKRVGAIAIHLSQNLHPIHDVLTAWLSEATPVPVHLFSKGKGRQRKKFGGRLDNKKGQQQTDDSFDWTHRAFEKLVLVYMRFSTREQREKNAYSYERQERLKQMAIQRGAKSELSLEEIEQIKTSTDYPGWYRDGQIIVEERGLAGVSGIKGQDERPGLAHLISLIERGLVSAVYVVDVTRLTREEYLIDAAQSAKGSTAK